MDLTVPYGSVSGCVDQLIDATVLYTSGGDPVELPVAGVWKSAEEKRETQTGAALLETTHCRFRVWADSVPGFVLTKGMRLRLADGTVWRATSAEKLARGTCWRLETIKERAA